MQTTIVNDTALLDALEAQIGRAKITIDRCWVNVGRSDSWQVTLRYDGDGGMYSGGGLTLRDAIANVLSSVILKRFTE